MNPITREESLLDGQDLEPITRKEQFIKRIYDKTQEIPDPITREEWFLKKAGEGTSPITIEQLNVTENGTYSETGKAYSPVIVEVPAPTLITKTITENGTYNASEDNADGYSQVTVAVEGFKKKSIANTPTDIASFNDGTANPMPSLEISIEPAQAGSGDPSPQNVRPISGWSGANVTVCDDVSDPTETHTTTIPFHDSSDNPITVYGGTLNVTSGELTATMASVDMGTLNWDIGYLAFVAKITNPAPAYDNDVPANMLCTKYPIKAYTGQPQKSLSRVAGTDLIRFLDSDYESTAAVKTAMQGVQLVYELATPQTYQLTPAQVTTLLGQNNIFADCGQILEGEYFVTL